MRYDLELHCSSLSLAHFAFVLSKMLVLFAFLTWYISLLQQAVVVFRPDARWCPNAWDEGNDGVVAMPLVMTVQQVPLNVGVAHMCASPPSFYTELVFPDAYKLPSCLDCGRLFLMPRAMSTWERLWSRTGFTTRWKYSSFFYSLRNCLPVLGSHCLTSPLVLVASVQYIVSGDNLSLCIVVAQHIGVHLEDCHQTSALLMVAITQAEYHRLVVAVLAGAEFHYGTFGKQTRGAPGSGFVWRRWRRGCVHAFWKGLRSACASIPTEEDIMKSLLSEAGIPSKRVFLLTPLDFQVLRDILDLLRHRRDRYVAQLQNVYLCTWTHDSQIASLSAALQALESAVFLKQFAGLSMLDPEVPRVRNSSFRPAPDYDYSVFAEHRARLHELRDFHFLRCSHLHTNGPGVHTPFCDCMDDAREIILDRMRGQMSQEDWCVQNTSLAGGCPWFWNFCQTVGKSEGDFDGKLMAGGDKAMDQLRNWNATLVDRLLEPRPLGRSTFVPRFLNQDYALRQIGRFWAARDMTAIIQTLFHPPTFDCVTGLLSYVALLSDRGHRLNDSYGQYQHGTRMECLTSILAEGFRDSSHDDAEDNRLWGGRTFGSLRGVYMYSMADSRNLGNGYSTYTHLFGDGLFYAPCFYLVADYEQRITPSPEKMVVIPGRHVFVSELHIHITDYAGIQPGAAVVPVWIPELEV